MKHSLSRVFVFFVGFLTVLAGVGGYEVATTQVLPTWPQSGAMIVGTIIAVGAVLKLDQKLLYWFYGSRTVTMARRVRYGQGLFGIGKYETPKRFQG